MRGFGLFALAGESRRFSRPLFTLYIPVPGPRSVPEQTAKAEYMLTTISLQNSSAWPLARPRAFPLARSFEQKVAGWRNETTRSTSITQP
jgi:hypothetical protein